MCLRWEKENSKLFIKSCMSSWYRWKLTRWQYKERRWGEDSQFWTSAEESLLQQWVCPFPSGSLSQAPVQSHWPKKFLKIRLRYQFSLNDPPDFQNRKKALLACSLSVLDRVDKPEGQLCCIGQPVPIVPRPPSFDPSPTTNWETQESTWRAY